MNDMLYSWNSLLWGIKYDNKAYAYCPDHKGVELDVLNGNGTPTSQNSMSEIRSITKFVCPIDNKSYEQEGDFYTLRRRVLTIIYSESYKEADIIDLDNMYTPILRVSPKPKDDRYSLQVEIDETSTGKKLVIYAADRKDKGKTQIFIDPHTKKMSFDGKDLHPDMIFSKVVAYFKDGSNSTIKDGSKQERDEGFDT